MRINKYIALGSTLSRRGADRAVQMGRVRINGKPASAGSDVSDSDTVTLDDRPVTQPETFHTIIFNKPINCVCSKRGQGSQTIYDLLPEKFRNLNPIGRLDKDSSGLLLLTNDGNLAQRLSHPSQQKAKVYQVKLDKPLLPKDLTKVSGNGVLLGDGLSKFALRPLDNSGVKWQVTMSEGRNRQIRRTFRALDYKVTAIHRTQFGDYRLGNLESGLFETA